MAGLRADGLTPGLDQPQPLTHQDVGSSTQLVAFDCEEPTMKALKGMGACWDDVPAVAGDYARARDRIVAHVSALLAGTGGGTTLPSTDFRDRW
jgi:hypothetical protein